MWLSTVNHNYHRLYIFYVGFEMDSHFNTSAAMVAAQTMLIIFSAPTIIDSPYHLCVDFCWKNKWWPDANYKLHYFISNSDMKSMGNGTQNGQIRTHTRHRSFRVRWSIDLNSYTVVCFSFCMPATIDTVSPHKIPNETTKKKDNNNNKIWYSKMIRIVWLSFGRLSHVYLLI